MAINPNTQYPGQVTAPDTDYPLGGAKNETIVDALDGTPFEKAMLNDLFGFQQSLLDKAGIVASGNSETAPVSQYREALELFMAQTQNYTINGSGVVQQRADYTLIKDAYDFGPDRFAGMATGTLVSAGTLTQTAAASVGVTGFAHKFNQVTLTGVGVLFHRTRIESRDAKNFKNLKASLSCKVHHNAGVPVTYTLTVRKADAEDDFTTTTDISNDGGTAVADTTATALAFEDISMGDCSNGIEVELKIEAGAVTLKDFEQTDYQLKVGTVATPFKPEQIGAVLAECRRYYFNPRADSTAGLFLTFASGVVTSATLGSCHISFPVTMRVAPTASLSGSLRLFDSTSQAITGINVSYLDTAGGNIEFTVAAGLTLGRGVLFQANNSTTATIDYDAEL